jgi:class 3 adenylate cyclase
MFVDLVGSTALSAALDPEEIGAAIRVYQNAVAGETLRFEGHIAKFMGDGVLAVNRRHSLTPPTPIVSTI